jgi:hypothetical protein
MTEIKTKPVFVVWTNTDLTEGRGYQIPIHVCEHEATARRLCKGRGVQGSDATVQECEAVWHKSGWAVPGQIIAPTKDDLEKQVRLNENKHLLDRFLAAGFTNEEIKRLKGMP